jgi:hypothetical protein
LLPIGQVTFTGTFTLNHLYDFNHPSAQPFGTFSDQTVTGSSGIFSPFVSQGNILAGQRLWTGNNLPLFSLGGFTFLTTDVLITGADSSRFVLGLVQLSGNGYNTDPDNYISWAFTAPAYDISNFPEDITGPITLSFFAIHDNHFVPDMGSSVFLFAFSAACVVGLHRLRCSGKPVNHTPPRGT